MQKLNFKSTDFQCAKGYLLIEPEKQDTVEKTESGIVTSISKTMIEARPCSGKVIHSGNKKYSSSDFVVFASTDGIDVRMDDGEFLLLRAASIIGKRKV